jgi:hypothetical protein
VAYSDAVEERCRFHCQYPYLILRFASNGAFWVENEDQLPIVPLKSVVRVIERNAYSHCFQHKIAFSKNLAARTVVCVVYDVKRRCKPRACTSAVSSRFGITGFGYPMRAHHG